MCMVLIMILYEPHLYWTNPGAFDRRHAVSEGLNLSEICPKRKINKQVKPQQKRSLLSNAVIYLIQHYLCKLSWVEWIGRTELPILLQLGFPIQVGLAFQRNCRTDKIKCVICCEKLKRNLLCPLLNRRLKKSYLWTSYKCCYYGLVGWEGRGRVIWGRLGRPCWLVPTILTSP